MVSIGRFFFTADGRTKSPGVNATSKAPSRNASAITTRQKMFQKIEGVEGPSKRREYTTILF